MIVSLKGGMMLLLQCLSNTFHSCFISVLFTCFLLLSMNVWASVYQRVYSVAPGFSFAVVQQLSVGTFPPFEVWWSIQPHSSSVISYPQLLSWKSTSERTIFVRRTFAQLLQSSNFPAAASRVRKRRRLGILQTYKWRIEIFISAFKDLYGTIWRCVDKRVLFLRKGLFL